MHNTKKIISASLSAMLFCGLFAAQQATAQLSVVPNQTAAVLSSTIGGTGITITSPILTCSGQANGTFTVAPGTILGTGATTFDIGNGILLTTGKAIAAIGPEATLASTNDGTAGDPALATLALTPTVFDGCSLEFDFTAVGTSVSFNYIFGSEEYNHSTCGPYNDAFAFFISGPGIVGTQNMAIVPGTGTPGIPVTVNSVNSGVPGTGYTLANCTIMGPGSPFPAFFVDNTGGTRFTYKGFTTELAATHTVTPCSSYHLKMSVTDAGNTLYDSGVFIEAGSLTTPTITPGTVCVGATTPFTAPFAGGTWSSSNTGIASVNAATGVVTGVAAGTATITYGVSATCFLTTTVTVNGVLPASGNTSICIGTTTTLSDASPGGIWTSGNTFVATVNSVTGVVTGVSAGVATISYTLGSGCSATIVVTVNPTPSPVAGSPLLCIGYTMTLTDATPGGTWSSGTPAVATISPIGFVSPVTPGTTNITYTSAEGCPTVFPLTIQLQITSTLNAAVCQGDSYLFAGTTYTVAGTYTHTFITAVCDSGVTFNLTVHALSYTTLYDSICNGTTYDFNGTVLATAGTYTFGTTNIYGCDSTVTLNLFVKPIPPVPHVVTPVFYCQDQPAAPLSATGTGLTWYTVRTGGTGTTSTPVPLTTVPGATWYYVSQVLNGCEGPRDSVLVDVNSLPIALITTPRYSLCQYDTDTFAAAFITTASYTWTASGADIISSTTNDSAVVQFTNPGNHYVFLKVTNGACSATDSVLIQVVPPPEFSIYVQPNVCLGDTVVVAASFTTMGVTNCVWNFGDATIISGTSKVAAGPFYVTWGTTGHHFIEMHAAVGACVSKEVADTVDVHALPNAAFTYSAKNTLCEGDSVLFSALEKDYKWSYMWTPAHFFVNSNRPELYGKVEAAGNVTLDVTTEFGCKETYTTLIDAQKCCTLFFPNAFAPGTATRNAMFHPVTEGHHTIHELAVFNRWGQMVFNAASESTGWDGNYNGVPQDVGVYYYFVKYDCNGKTMEEKGEVTLVR
jgi:gliding motility-associated-like protein